MVNQLANNARAAMGALLCACCLVGGAASSTRAMPASQEQPASQQLKVYVDVEGGQSTRFVNPPGQSLLIDTGWPANIGKFKRRGWCWRAPIPGLP